MIELKDGDFVVLGGVKYKVNGSELLPIGRLVGPHGGEITTLGDAAKRSEGGPIVGVINVYLNEDHLLLKDGYFDLIFDCNGECVDYRVDANIPIEINIPHEEIEAID